MADVPFNEEETAGKDWSSWQTGLSSTARVSQDSLQSVRAPIKEPSFGAVVVDDDAERPTVHLFATIEQLRQFLVTLDENAWAMPFYGHVMSYSQPPPGSPLRHLISYDGSLLPLFDIPDTTVVASDYFRGDGPGRLYIEPSDD